MDTRVKKLTRKGLTEEVSQKLVDAGLTTPALIRVATQEELDAANVTAEDVVVIREA